MTPAPHIRLACYVRQEPLVAPIDDTLRTLERFESDGLIDEFTVDSWPAEVRLGHDALDSDVVALFEEFDAWATQWHVSIRPPFSVETHRSEFTGETCEVLHTPFQCLAIYVNDVLAEVFPHTADRTGDGETYTVREALDLLESHDIRAFGESQDPDSPPDPDHRPGGPLTGPEKLPSTSL